MANPSTIALNCFVIGDDPSQCFTVVISLADNIGLLAIEIARNYKICEGEELTGVKLFQCSLPHDKLSEIRAVPNESPLHRLKSVREQWSNPSAINSRVIHVLVYSPNHPRIKIVTHQILPLGDGKGAFGKLAIEQEATRKMIMDGPSTSFAALPNHFRNQQAKANAPIYNGRPWIRTGNPVELYHPAFRIFLDKTQQTETPLTEADYTSTRELLWASQDIYADESLRSEKLLESLSAVLDEYIPNEKVDGCRANGTIKIQRADASLLAYCSILEFSNEIGDALCDPSIQGAMSYAKYWSQDQATPIRNVSCCPSFIIAVAGPWVCILGSIYLTNIVVQPLTEMLWVADHIQKESRLVYLTRVFVALREAISHLKSYYQPIVQSGGSPLVEDPTRFYPDIRHFPAKDGKEIKIVYIESVARLAFKARTKDHRDVVVKFVQRYNPTAHELLSREGLAPQLLFDSGDCRYGGYRMVVMEFIPGKSLKDYSEELGGMQNAKTELQPFRQSVERALKILHDADLVFGDVRGLNVMVTKEDNGENATKLIDFDWCAPAGEGRYPANLNTGIPWAAGVESGGLMQKAHDNEMVESVFNGYTYFSSYGGWTYMP